MTEISVSFVFPGEGADIDGEIVTPDSPVLDGVYIWPGSPEYYRRKAKEASDA